MITAIIIAKNESKNIESAIKSVSFCDEVVVINNKSSDNTAEIAKKAHAQVYSYDNENFAEMREYGMKKAKGEWLLFIDADERISSELKNEINLTLSKSPQYDSYTLPRVDFFWNKQITHGEVLEAYYKGIIRLMKKNSGHWQGRVHEQFVPKKKNGKLVNYIEHYPHPSIKDFLNDVNYYSTLRAEELYNKGISTNIVKIFVFPFGKFFYTFIILGGFLDGAPGFVYSFMMSFHSFLVQSKLFVLKDTS